MTGYGMEIISDKSKILVNSIEPRSSTNIRMNGKVLGKVNQFKYLGSTQTNHRASLKEVNIRLAQTYNDKASSTMEKHKAISFSHKD